MIRSVIVLCALVVVVSASPLSWKIIGGQDAKEGQFPYQASMRIGQSHFCGCTIINGRWFLTAAHCLDLDDAAKQKINIAVGSNRNGDLNATVYQPQNLIPHEKYNYLSLANDIALIKVTKPIDMGGNDNVKDIPLNTQEIPDQSEVILSGWGDTESRSENLQWIKLKTLNNQKCQEMYWDSSIMDTQLCTLTKEGEGACFGDSGGPLVWEGKLCGIVSFGIPCGRGMPDVFTRVSEYIPWINAQIAANSD